MLRAHINYSADLTLVPHASRKKEWPVCGNLKRAVRLWALVRMNSCVATFEVSWDSFSTLEAKDQLWASIPKAESVEAVPITQNTMPTGEVVQNEPVNVEAQLAYKYEDIRSCNTEELAAQMDAAAEQNLSVVMPHLFDVMGRTCQAAGTTSDAGGKPLSFELLLSGLAKIDISFDKEGKPELPTLVVGPELGNKFGHCRPRLLSSKKP